MYFRGLGGNTRLWLFDPPGSPNCPPNLTSGCYNTGLKEGCGDPRQFATWADLQMYANSRGEGLQQVGSAQEAATLCTGGRATAAPPPPAPPPVFTQVAAPGYVPPGTPGGTRLLPTGVATPTAPQIVTVPGGGTVVMAPEPAETVEEAGLFSADMLPWLAIGAIGLFALTRGRR